MEFGEFCDRAAAIEAETADLETVGRVAELFLAAGEVLPLVARFVQGRVFPAWSSVTLDVGPKLCYEALARAAGHEGLMLKAPTSPYRPGRRGKRWLKVKPEVDTLDCVVTGAEWGEGRRANRLGTYELSVRTDGGFTTVGNVATGFTDADLAELTERFEPLVRSSAGQRVELEPSVVFEVGYAEIQTSPNYATGYALRFPRYVGVREDKAPDDADTLERVRRLAGESGPSSNG